MSKQYKSIDHAYATSPRAKELGFYDTGCYFVNQRCAVLGTAEPAHNGEGYAKPDDSDLISFYHETDGVICPMFAKYGNVKSLNAIKDNKE